MARKRSNTEDNGVATEEPRARQGHLPEMEPPSIPEIDEAAEAFVDARDKRMRLGSKEAEKKEILEAAMKKHGLDRYEYDGKEVVFEGNLKVRKIPEAKTTE